MCINICFSVFFFGFVNQSVKSKTPYIYLEHATVVTFTGSLSLILRAVQVSRVCGMLLLSHNILWDMVSRTILIYVAHFFVHHRPLRRSC